MDSDVVLIEMSNSSSNINVTNSQAYVGHENFLKRKEKEAQKRCNEVNVDIDLEEEILKLAPSDILNIFRYDNLGLIVSEKLYYPEDDGTMLTDPISGGLYKKEEILETVGSNLRYIDLDKLLVTILLVEFDKHEGNLKDFSIGEAKALKKLMEKIEKHVGRKNLEIYSDRFSEKMSFDKIKACIEELNHSFVNGVFYSEEEINDLAKEYVYGSKDVSTLSADEFKGALKFTDGEVEIMIKRNPDLLEYFLDIDALNLEQEKNEQDADKKLFGLLEKQDKITQNQLQILYTRGKLSPEHLLELYMEKDKVDLESIDKIKDYVDEEFLSQMVDTPKLVDLYLYKDEDDDGKFDKYRKLYKRLAIDDKSLEEKNDISNDILESSMELLKEESVLELYNLGLVTVDALIGLTGISYLKQLYVSHKLKPTDAKRLFYDGTITEEMLITIMSDKTIDEGEKLSLMYSTFPYLEDMDVRIRLEAYLREVEENARSKGTSTRNRASGEKESNDSQKPSSEDGLKKLRKAYDPCSKFGLILKIDPETTYTYNGSDGTEIFYFPNRDEYMIEKLYGKGKKPATDVATYIVDKNTFEKNKDRIFTNGKINISELYALKKSNSKGVKRLVHTGWANAIVKYYSLDDETRYSKKQIAEIKKLAKEVEESKREVER